ncbi:Uncharacterized protein TCM_040096 [Theobroma cacao]|uniref:Uncharacterized protein n=1 Tax=Theobroma cacao TaxID=3641 RepID=A0A061GYS0_THECC|nr:Uncharacterized protein TCM_040096 [Theobroma cacao]
MLEMVTTFEKASGKKIPIKLWPRRLRDVAAVCAFIEKAQKELGRVHYGCSSNGISVGNASPMENFIRNFQRNFIGNASPMKNYVAKAFPTELI